MAGKEVSKKRKAAPVSTTTTKKARKTTKGETKTASKPVPAPAAPVVKPAAPVQEDEITFEEEEQDAPSEHEEDDQTAALLAGFESSSDEEEGGDAPSDANAITTIPSIPTSSALQSQLTAAASSTHNPNNHPGVIYIGRIPHGFYEHQMRAYFSQFGHITRLRLSRNRKTGASKHYAFIEFASAEVARIVADTMDNYLMFGHILKVKLVPRDQVHEELFKGAGVRFKRVPWNRIERFRLQGADREGWEKRIKSEEKRRTAKAAKLKELGYEFEAPKLKEVTDVPVKPKAVEAAPAAEALENTPSKTLESGDKAAPVEVQVQGPASGEPVAVTVVVKEVAAPEEASKSPEVKQTKKVKKVAIVTLDSTAEEPAKAAKKEDGKTGKPSKPTRTVSVTRKVSGGRKVSAGRKVSGNRRVSA